MFKKKDKDGNEKVKKKSKQYKNDKVYTFWDRFVGLDAVEDYGAYAIAKTLYGYAVVLKISTTDIYYSSDEEKDRYLVALYALANNLDFAIKFKTTNESVNLKKYTDKIEVLDTDTRYTREYIYATKDHLLSKSKDKNIYVRSNYAIIYANYRTSDITPEAERELKNDITRRIRILMSSLEKADIKTRMLRYDELLQFLYVSLNRKSEVDFVKVLESGGASNIIDNGVSIPQARIRAHERSIGLEKEMESPSAVEAETTRGREFDFLTHGARDIKKLFVPNGMKEEEDHLYFGPGKYARMMVLDSLTSFLSVGYLNFIFGLGEVESTVIFNPVSKTKALKDVTKNLEKAEANIAIAEKNRENVDYQLRRTRDSLEKLRMDIQTGDDTLHYVQIILTLWAEDLQKLDRLTQTVEEEFARYDVIVRTCIMDQASAFRTAFPLDGRYFKESVLNVKNGSALCLFPEGNTELVHEKGIWLGMNVNTFAPVVYDRFLGQRKVAESRDILNPHVFVSGKSGSGKSTTLKLIIGRSYQANHFCVVFDMDGEYKSMASKFNARYMKIEANSKTGLNPMDVITEKDENGLEIVNLNEKVEEVKLLIASIYKDINQKGLDGVQLNQLEKAVRNTYKEYGIGYDPESLYEESDGTTIGKVLKKMPILSDIKTSFKKLFEEDADRELLNIIEYITGDSVMSIFDCRTTVDIDFTRKENRSSRLLFISLEETRGTLRSFAIKNVMSWIASKFANIKLAGIEKNLVIDEAWEIAKTEEDLAYVEFFARKGRKQWLSLTIATQKPGDFMKEGSVGEAIVNQCETKMFLKQDKNEAMKIARMFHLSPTVGDIIAGFDKGEMFLINGAGLCRLQMELTPYEKLFAET